MNAYQFNPIYTDTDSILMEESDYYRFIKAFPTIIGKDFGYFDYEKGTFNE